MQMQCSVHLRPCGRLVAHRLSEMRRPFGVPLVPHTPIGPYVDGLPDRFINVNLCDKALVPLGIGHLVLPEGVER
jgi:hypothetical protein